MIISGERRISYPEIFARAAKAATGLSALGLSGGTPVAMMLRNDFASPLSVKSLKLLN